MSKKPRKTKQDPNHTREAEKYEHPVASREHIISIIKQHGKPLSYPELMDILTISSDKEKEGLRRRLRAMERDFQLVRNRRKKYALLEQMDVTTGYIQGHRDGFGFLIPDDDGEDVFLPAREMRSVFPMDRVSVRVTGLDRRGRREGVIVEVLETKTRILAGRFYHENGVSFVDPDDKAIAQDIIIPSDKTGNAKPGEYVEIEIISQPSKRRQPTARVTEVLGSTLTPGMEVELALRSHDIPHQWPDVVNKAIQQIPTKIPSSVIKTRRDFRELPFVTIDGSDAKDYDDAVYCEARKNGWTLYVAIADVSYYVKPDSPLDLEARERGNSVYFPSKVIPMLPFLLSNELCSLMPKVDRLTLVCEMTIKSDGSVSKYQFHEGIIHSHARLTYDTVAHWLDNPNQADQTLFPHIKTFHELYQKLHALKVKRGAIEFDTQETKIRFDDSGKIDAILPVKRNVAHKMIEEAMLLANVCTAKFLEKSKLPALYRIHEQPQPRRLDSLRDFLKSFGLRLSGGNSPTGLDYAKLQKRAMKRSEAKLIQTVMMRSLQQAIYFPENLGHFGLAYPAYTHFTSPIRRYTDLIIHRAIKHQLSKKTSTYPYRHDAIQSIAEHVSMTERRADLATRDATDWLKCDYMKDKLGGEYQGMIIEVTGFGIFVELTDCYVQGLVHISTLGKDHFQYQQAQHQLVGLRSGKKYRLGDSVKVTVAKVDLDQRKIDFVLA